ncbi:MAG: HPF/RaiA family ribosome-associated protein [Nitrospirae bacterium]|nr:HPF/RaiA family ribosome-associated protein [Nitrospirota bacterium]
MEMNFQLQTHNIKISDSVKDEISRKAEKLTEFYDRINRCRVVVDMPHRHSNEGGKYEVRIDMTLPGSEIVIKQQGHEDIAIAVREAFDAARRKLEDYGRRQRGDVKYHEAAPRARISALHMNEGYGFITTADGREIYFHENSVTNHEFSRLKVEMEVRFVEAKGEKGPQASSVTILSD